MAQNPPGSGIDLDDYTAIEQAVMETSRGRWFLAEFAARNRRSDTTLILEAVSRLERSLTPAQPLGATAAPPVEIDQIRFDLVEMATAIARTKAEVAAMKPDVDHSGALCSATEHLDIIVAQTEAATSDILAAAEQVQEIAWTLREHGVEDEVCDILDGKATDIYTACSFQDLTGQRIRRVLDVLHYLENRLSALVGIWGLEGAAVPTLPSQEESRDLVSGPAKPGEGLDQSDVDSMMVPPTADEFLMPAAEADEIAAVPASTTDIQLDPAVGVDVLTAEPDEEIVEQPVPPAPHGEVIAATEPSAPELANIETQAATAAPRAAQGNPFSALDALSPEEKLALFA